MSSDRLDCLLVGHNESPLAEYEKRIRAYGEDSEAYRDLMFSMLEVNRRKLSYVDLLNHLYKEARSDNGAKDGQGEDFFKSGEIPNLAAVYLTNFLRRRGYLAEYVNLFQHDREQLENPPGGSPLTIALTTTLYVLNFPAIEIVEHVRLHHPHSKIIVGGPLVSNHARNFSGDQLAAALADIGADIFVIEGQGEATLVRIIECLKTGGDLATIPNIAYFEGNRLRVTHTEPEANPLDENYIDWTTFRDHNLGPAIQTRTARSCAFKCAFCNYPTRAGKLTLATVDVIEKEMESIHRLGNVKNVVFIDDTFNVPLPRFKEFCRLMIRKQYGLKWFSYFRCSNADDETFDLMAESGCCGVFLGIESGSPTILTNMDKHATIEKYRHGIEQLKARGILTFGSFIVGFPGETEETVRETTDFIRSTRPDYYRVQMWYNEEGTPIHHRQEEFDISGDGFVWEHATMDSLGAMDCIDRMFLEIKESTWLPQWSFDFWIIPYLTGLGMTLEQFDAFTRAAHQMLPLEIAALDPEEKRRRQEPILREMLAQARSWQIKPIAAAS